MSLLCCCEGEGDYIEIPEEMVTSPGTEFCVECGRLIPFGEEHYRARLWTWGEMGEETERGVYVTCEACGDLAVSFLDLGYCWSFGDLRGDIKELNGIE